jgi:hypothetical protein
MQQGGSTEEQVMQLIQMYAQLTETDPQEIMNELQGMSPQEQGQAIQQIQQAVQSVMSEQQGQQMQRPGMAKGGSYSGTYDAGTGSYFSHGGSYGRRLRMAQYGYEIPERPTIQDYPDYGSFKLADDDWMMTYGEGAINVPDINQQLANYEAGYENPAANILASGSPMAPIPVPTAAVTTQASTENPADYDYSVVNYLNKNGIPSSYDTRKNIATILNIPNYRGRDDQNVQMLQTLIKNPTLLQTVIGGAGSKGKGSNSTSKAIKNIRKKAEAQGAIGGGNNGGSGFAPPIVKSDSTRTVVTDSTTGKPIVITDSTKSKIDSLAGKPRNDFGFRDTTNTGGGGRPENKPKPSSPGTTAIDVVKTLGTVGLGAGLTYMYARMTAPQRVDQILKALSKNPKFVQASDNLKNQMLEKAVADVEATYKSYKQLPKQQQAILDNLDAMEIPGYYPGEDVGDPAARAEALFAEQEAIQERQAMSRYADQEAADANAEAELERRIESQYADAEAANAIAEANAEEAMVNETALRRAGAGPRKAKTIARNQTNVQNMLDEAAAEEAAYQEFIKSKMVKAPVKAGPTSGTTSLRQRLLSGIQNRMPVGRPSMEVRPEIRGQVPEMPSRLGQAGKFIKGLFREVGKKEYGGGYIPNYGDTAYAPSYYGGGMYREGGGRALVNRYDDGGSYNNPGFRALPKKVQLNIMGRTPQAMYGMGMQEGGVVEVNESELPQVVQQLKQGGYQFEIMR